MKMTIEKMDKLQEELDNVRRDFFKLSSLNSSGSNIKNGVKVDGNDCKVGEEEKVLQVSDTYPHEGSRKVMQFNNNRNLSIETIDLNHDHYNDNNSTARYHLQGARIPPDLNWNINQGGDLEAPSTKLDNEKVSFTKIGE